MTEQEITQYLVKKYQPHAVLLHGSRAAGVNVTPETDWDIALIMANPEQVLPERIGECRLDVDGIPVEQLSLTSNTTPCLPMRVLYDDALGLGRRLVENNQQIFDKGPSPLTEQEITNRRNHLDRLVWRLNKRQADPVSSLGYKGDIIHLACRYWCQLQGKWPQAIYRVVLMIEQEDPEFFALLKALDGPEAVTTAREVHRRLFGE